MLKLRLKRHGRRKKPFYRIVVMNVKTKRDGKVIEDLGFYNPMDKTLRMNWERVKIRLKNGARPTKVVENFYKQYLEKIKN
uniref:30S ribosomal protein S16 n=1 Tax=Ascoseira mirabilis TaxID=76830 RepID=UPI0030034A1E|nr:30S ribosomal protein S16 [Ascoseira mirabilis]